MAKSKKKFNKVLHPNRYFIWALVLLCLSAFALLGLIAIGKHQIDYQAVYSTSTSRKTYNNVVQGYSAQYPQSWQLETDRANSTIFENPVDTSDSITVFTSDAASESLVAKSLGKADEWDFTKGGMRFRVFLKGQSGIPFTNTAIIVAGEKMYLVTGDSKSFQPFIMSFRSIQ